MNDSTKINLLGDVFEVHSLKNGKEIEKNLNGCIDNIAVFIYPSLSSDFSVRAYQKNQKEFLVSDFKRKRL